MSADFSELPGNGAPSNVSCSRLVVRDELRAPAGSMAIAHDATLSGDGTSGNPLGIAAAVLADIASRLQTVSHDASLLGDGTGGNPLRQSWTPTTPARALNVAFQPSATKYTLCIYSVQIASSTGDDGTVEMRSDAAVPPVTVRCSFRAAVSGLIGDTGTTRAPLVYLVPPGDRVLLATSGTGVFTLSHQTEIALS